MFEDRTDHLVRNAMGIVLKAGILEDPGRTAETVGGFKRPRLEEFPSIAAHRKVRVGRPIMH
jgi:hypothetical protein